MTTREAIASKNVFKLLSYLYSSSFMLVLCAVKDIGQLRISSRLG